MAELVMVEHATVLVLIALLVTIEPDNVDPMNPVVRSIVVDRLDIVIAEDIMAVLPVSVEYDMANALLVARLEFLEVNIVRTTIILCTIYLVFHSLISIGMPIDSNRRR
jgi:hypothetical protein